ncbi:MAG: carbon-nitrogen hydrolase family protein [Anaerolineae bacterium]
MRQITVAAVQMAPKLADVEANLERMGKWVEDICREQKVDLIVFPELVSTGYECGVRFADLAEQVPGHIVNYMAEQAADFRVHLAFGLVEKQKLESVIYDAAVLLNPDGEVNITYRKVHLRGEERLAFRPGYRFPIAETSFGIVGLLLGWDLAFPEAARCLTLQGAELLCVCANWERPNTSAWRNYVFTRALENSLFVVAANRIGEEYTYNFFGDSTIVGPRGEVYSTLDEDIEGYGLATIDLDEVRKNREDSQLFQVRQPRSYREIVRMY